MPFFLGWALLGCLERSSVGTECPGKVEPPLLLGRLCTQRLYWPRVVRHREECFMQGESGLMLDDFGTSCQASTPLRKMLDLRFC